MADNVEYPPVRAGFADALARLSEQDAATQKLTARQEALTGAELEGVQAQQRQVQARLDVAAAINREIAAMQGLSSQLTREGDAIVRNTELLQANAAARLEIADANAHIADTAALAASGSGPIIGPAGQARRELPVPGTTVGGSATEEEATVAQDVKGVEGADAAAVAAAGLSKAAGSAARDLAAVQRSVTQLGAAAASAARGAVATAVPVTARSVREAEELSGRSAAVLTGLAQGTRVKAYGSNLQTLADQGLITYGRSTANTGAQLGITDSGQAALAIRQLTAAQRNALKEVVAGTEDFAANRSKSLRALQSAGFVSTAESRGEGPVNLRVRPVDYGGQAEAAAPAQAAARAGASQPPAVIPPTKPRAWHELSAEEQALSRKESAEAGATAASGGYPGAFAGTSQPPTPPAELEARAAARRPVAAPGFLAPAYPPKRVADPFKGIPRFETPDHEKIRLFEEEKGRPPGEPVPIGVEGKVGATAFDIADEATFTKFATRSGFVKKANAARKAREKAELAEAKAEGARGGVVLPATAVSSSEPEVVQQPAPPVKASAIQPELADAEREAQIRQARGIPPYATPLPPEPEYLVRGFNKNLGIYRHIPDSGEADQLITTQQGQGARAVREAEKQARALAAANRVAEAQQRPVYGPEPKPAELPVAPPPPVPAVEPAPSGAAAANPHIAAREAGELKRSREQAEFDKIIEERQAAEAATPTPVARSPYGEAARGGAPIPGGVDLAALRAAEAERNTAAEELRKAQARYNRQESATQRANPNNIASQDRLGERELELEQARQRHQDAIAAEEGARTAAPVPTAAGGGAKEPPKPPPVAQAPAEPPQEPRKPPEPAPAAEPKPSSQVEYGAERVGFEDALKRMDEYGTSSFEELSARAKQAEVAGRETAPAAEGAAAGAGAAGFKAAAQTLEGAGDGQALTAERVREAVTKSGVGFAAAAHSLEATAGESLGYAERLAAAQAAFGGGGGIPPEFPGYGRQLPPGTPPLLLTQGGGPRTVEQILARNEGEVGPGFYQGEPVGTPQPAQGAPILGATPPRGPRPHTEELARERDELARRQAAEEFQTVRGPGVPFVVPPGEPALRTPVRVSGTPPLEGEKGIAPIGRTTAAEELNVQTSRAAIDYENTLAEAVAKSGASYNQSAAQLAAYSTALTRHGALSTEFIQALAAGEVTLGQFGTALVSTIGKFGGWAVAGGLVYGAYEAIKKVYDGLKETSSGVTQLERALPHGGGLSPRQRQRLEAQPYVTPEQAVELRQTGVNRKEAEEGFIKASKAINVPIETIANAQFFAARSGFHGQRESLQVGEVAAEAAKLDEVPVQDAAKAFGALHKAFPGYGAEQVKKTFHELNTGQLEFNARLAITLPQITRAASAFANAGGTPEQLAQQIIEVTGVTGGGGGQGGGTPATLFIKEAPFILKNQHSLRRFGFNPQEAVSHLGDFNRELQRRSAEGQYTEAEERELGQIIGGPAIGGRYGLGLIRAGKLGTAKQVEEATGVHTPSAGRAEDLGTKLSQLNEQLPEIAREFEAIGADIGKVGVTVALEDLAKIVKTTAGAFEVVAKPLLGVGDAISHIPGFIQQALVVGGLGAVGTRFLRSDRVTGFSGPLGEVPILGKFGVDSSAKQQLRQLQGVVRETDSVLSRRVGEAGARDFAAQAELRKATNARAAYALSEEGQAGRLANEAYIANPITANDTAERKAHTSRQAGLEAREEAAAARAKQTNEGVVEEQQLHDENSERKKRLSDKTKSRPQRVAEEAEAGGAATGAGARGIVYGAEGPQGAAREAARARQGLPPQEERPRQPEPPRERAAPVAAPGVIPREDITTAGARAVRDAVLGSTEEVAATGVLFSDSLGRIAVETDEGAAAIGVAYKSNAALLREGGAEVFLSLKTLAGELRGGAGLSVAAARAGEQAKGGLSDVGAVAGRGFSGLGSKFFPALFTAYGVSAAAELGAAVLPGGVGKTVGNIGTYAALGAGIGTFLPGGPLTTVLGGLAGAGIGGVAELLKTGEPKPHIPPILRAENAHETFAEHLNASAEQWGEEINTAFEGETESAQKALATVRKHLKLIGAALKLYPEGTPEGHGATLELGRFSQKVAEELAYNPKELDAALALQEETTKTGIEAIKRPFDRTLKRGRSTPQVLAGLQAADQRLRAQEEQKVQERRAVLEGTLKRQEQELLRDNRGEAEARAQRAAVTPQQNLQAQLERAQNTQKDPAKRKAEEEKIRAEYKGYEAKEGRAADLKNSLDPAVLYKGRLRKLQEEYDKLGEEPGSAKNRREETRIRGEVERLTSNPATAQGTKLSPDEFRSRAVKKGEEYKQTAAAIKRFDDATKAVKEEIEAAYEEFAEQALAKVEGNAKPKRELRLARAGNDAQARAQAETENRAEERKNLNNPAFKLTPEQRKLKSEELAKGELETSRNTQRAKVEERSANSSLEIAQRPVGTTQAQVDRKRAAATRRKVSEEEAANSRVPHTYTKTELISGQAEAAEATLAAEEATLGERGNIISLRGQISEASKFGKPVAQAREAKAVAQQLLGLAKNEEQRLRARLEIVNAGNAEYQAEQNNIQLSTELAESKKRNPFERSGEAIKGLGKQIKKARAKGDTEGVEKFEAQRNNLRRQHVEELVSESEAETQQEFAEGHLTNFEAAEKLRNLLKRDKGKTSNATRRQLREQIYQLETDTQRDFAVGSVAEGPTLYSALTLTPKAPGATAPGQAPVHAGAITAPAAHTAHVAEARAAQFNQRTNIYITVPGSGHPREVAEHVAAHLERTFHTHTRAHLRSAGLHG